MLAPSKKLLCAVEAVLYIAYNARTSPIASSELATALHLSPRYLEAMAQNLVRAGILRSHRGAKGGYMLGRERRLITLADICSTIPRINHLPPNATNLGKTLLHPLAQDIIQYNYKLLEKTTIADLCNQAMQANLPSHEDHSTDFTI